jgi:hypothetical protein
MIDRLTSSQCACDFVKAGLHAIADNRYNVSRSDANLAREVFAARFAAFRI